MGKFAGGIVNLSTKGGSNEFHGVAYEYLRNKVLQCQTLLLDNESSVRGRTSTAARLAGRSSKKRRSSSSPMTWVPPAGVFSIYYHSAHRFAER